MSAYFNLTNGPARVPGVTKQLAANALDLGDYRELNALLQVLEVVGGGAATIRLLTSSSNHSEEGWVVAATFAAASGSAPAPELKQVLAFLRYVRWEVSSLTGSSPSVVFVIDGIAKGE